VGTAWGHRGATAPDAGQQLNGVQPRAGGSFRVGAKVWVGGGGGGQHRAMRTYRELFGVAEFRALFGVACLRYGGSTMAGIALGTLVYGDTRSPLLSALAMFGPSAAQVLSAATLLSWVDRVRPRAALTAIGAAYTAVALLLALPWSAGWLLSVALLSGVIGAVGGGVQWGLLREVTPAGGYVLARSTFTIAAGLTQILGFGLGGVLVNAIGSRPVLLVTAGVFAASSLAARFGLRDRPCRATDRPSVRSTWRDNRRLLGTPERRALYLMLWVPNGLVVGCEALFIPYAPHWAGLLMAAAGLGMLAGDLLVARVLRPGAQSRFAALLRLALAAPYLPFALGLPLPVAVAAVAVASVGYAAGLLLQQRLLAIVPDELAGHTLGLHSAGMLTTQALAAVLAGTLAEALPPATVMTVLAAASLLITLVMAPRLRTGDRWLRTATATAAGR
jgi:MFS family permease